MSVEKIEPPSVEPETKPDKSLKAPGIFALSRKDQTKANTLSVAIETLNNTDHPLYEHTELGWDGNLDELVLFMLVESC